MTDLKRPTTPETSSGSSIIDPEKQLKHEKHGLNADAGPSVRPADRVADALVHETFVTTDDGPDYRGVSWGGAFVLMLKSQIGLGVLSLPRVLTTVGYVPGILLIIVLGVITTYGDYEIGRFMRVYPGVHSVGDVGLLIGGPIGQEVIGWSYLLLQCFVVAAGILTSSVALNAVSSHATCTVVFAVAAAVFIGIIGSARTFKQISWVGWVGMFSILPAIFLVTIAVGVSDRPAGAPAGVFDKELKAFNNPTFAEAISAVVVVLFSYGGSAGWFSVIAEMKDPREYNKAMLCAQGLSMIVYITISTVMWYYCGVYVSSPALGSAGPVIKKIAYGIAIPGLLAGPVIAVHSSVKFCFVRILRGSHHLQSSTPTHYITWFSLCIAVTAFSFIIAQVIPFFNDLIALIGAVFVSTFCITIFGPMWLFDNKRHPKPPSLTRTLLHINAYFFILAGLFIFAAGLYGSILGIKAGFANGTVGRPFPCADNSV